MSKFLTVATDEFVNWSGGLRFTPRLHIAAQNEEALCTCIRSARTRGEAVRAVGSGHSSSPLVRTDDVLISLENFCGVLAHDAVRHQAVVGAGTRLHDLGRLLHEVGLGMENLGDVDTQTIAGVVGTGTHGSGRKLQNISATLVGARLITGEGQALEWNVEREPDRLRALRVSLGSLGVLVSLRLQLEPAYRLRRREYCAHIDDCLEHFDAIADFHRNFDFYWYPRRDEAKIRTLNPPERPAMHLPFAKLVREEEGFSHEIIAQTRELKFEELEYFVPMEAGLACFRAVRRRIRERHRKHVGWRVLVRLIAADDAWLSPVHGRDSLSISVHQNATLPYQEYFDDIEPVLRDHGGRPHWAKRHSLHGAQLARLYPQWECFMTLRRQLDPGGVLLSNDVARLFGEAKTA